MTKKFTKKPGQILILSILLMAAISASTIAVSTIIADTVHQSQSINDFISASLLADSGVERGLAVIKVGRVNKTIQESTNAIAFTSTSPNLAVTGTSTSGQIEKIVLKKNESITFDVLKYDANGLTSVGVAAEFNNLIINGTTDTAGTKLDVAWIGLDTNFLPKYSGRRVVIPNTSTAPYIYDRTLNLVTNVYDPTGIIIANINQTGGFRVRVKALYGPVSINYITTQGTDGTVRGLPSRLNIDSIGQVGLTQSEKRASVMWQLSASPVFNYVLFTEGDIIPAS